MVTSDRNLMPVTIPKFLESSSGDHGDQAEFMDHTSDDLHEFLKPVSGDQAKILRRISDCEIGFLECPSDDKVGSVLDNDISWDSTAVPDSSCCQVGLKLLEFSDDSVWMGSLTDAEESYNLNNIGHFLSIPKKEKTDEDLEIEKEHGIEGIKQNDPLISCAWE
ncbi:hypothetical protein X975_26559, partial [Stegodyphus mimosarum]